MDAERALADLLEISPQVEAAAILDGTGGALGSVGVEAAAAAELVRAGRDLLAEAAELGRDGASVTQLHVSLSGGEVFAVGGTERQAIVAAASTQAQPGLVFYDLKRCLAALGEER